MRRVAVLLPLDGGPSSNFVTASATAGIFVDAYCVYWSDSNGNIKMLAK